MAKLSSPRNSMIIEGSKGPPTAEMNPKITFDKITAKIVKKFFEHHGVGKKLI